MATLLIGPCVSFLECVIVNSLEAALVKYADLNARSGLFALLQTVTRIEKILEERKKARIHAALQHFSFALNHLTENPLPREKEMLEEIPDSKMKHLTKKAFRKDYSKSALTYFENCIESAVLALSENPSIQDRILLIEAMSLSQILSEDLPGARKNIIDSFTQLSQHRDVINAYYELCYIGCLANSAEVALAKSIFRLHTYFQTLLGLIPQADSFLIRVERSAYHPQGHDVFMINPLDPPMLIRTCLQKGFAGAKLVAAGTTAVPLSIGAGLVVSAVYICLSPIGIPFLGFETLSRNSGWPGRTWQKYWKETREDFNESMCNLGKLIASPVLFPHKLVGAILSEDIGKNGQLKWEHGKVVLEGQKDDPVPLPHEGEF